MHALVDWIKRLKGAGPDGRFHRNLRRVIVPGISPLGLDNCLIRIAPIGRINERPGATPEAVSVIEWIDTESQPKPIDMQREMASSLGALLTLITERRIEVAEELPLARAGSSGTAFLAYGLAVDRRLYGPIDVDLCVGMKTWLANLASLQGDDVDAIGAAIDLHYGATLLLEKDLSSAYALLVAGIETLSRRYGSPPQEWERWEQSGDWEEFAKELGLTESQREALFSRLMEDRNLRLAETFADYASTRVRDSFWDRPWNEWGFLVNWSADGANYMAGDWLSRKKVRDVVPHDREILRTCLKKTYAVRSRFVHEGSRVDFTSQAVAYASKIDVGRPLPFAVLRSILGELVEVEVHEQASGFDLPNIVISAPRD